jgi:hypothetical protein
VWVFEIDGWDGGSITEDHGTDTWAGGAGYTTVDSPSAGAQSAWIGAMMLQKVNYGQATMIVNNTGTNLLNCNGFNTSGLTCGSGDGSPPWVFAGYDEGTGVLSIGALPLGGCTFWTGATPNYNLFGRGWGGLLIPLAEPLTIVQQGFGYAVSADVAVNLPSAP